MPTKPDEDFEVEYNSANKAGIGIHLISLESLREGNAFEALRRTPVLPEKEIAIYRGWMLRPAEYEKLYNGLLQKNIQLINSPDEYLACHYFPNAYEKIQDCTPKSIFFKVSGTLNFDELTEKLKIFGNRAIIVKDYVKSEKHYWEQACFIPDASDRQAVERVTNRFLELRGNFLNEGLVFREFIELERLATRSKSRMPIANEFRLFYLANKLFDCVTYWNEGEYNDEQPELEKFNQIASQIKSNLFTIDVAKKQDGDWIIMELGNGQVSGLPEKMNTDAFYERLKQVT